MIAQAEPSTEAVKVSPERKRKRQGVNIKFHKRMVVYNRDGWRCQYCGRDLLESIETLQLATVDHVYPRHDGGEIKSVDNMVTACLSCNFLKAGALTKSLSEARQLVSMRRAAWAARYLEEIGRLGLDFPRKKDADLFGTMPVAGVAEMLVDQAEQMAQTFRVVLNMANPEAIARRRAQRWCSIAWITHQLRTFLKKRKPRRKRMMLRWTNCQEKHQEYHEDWYGTEVTATA